MGKTEQSKTYHTSQLIETAIEQLKYSYTPYSGFKVGAALLAKNGTVYTGCNIENAAYTPTNCAERTAFFKAVSEGVKEFDAICIVGGKNGVLTEYAPPCGVCRQVMMEFCDPEEFDYVPIKRACDAAGLMNLNIEVDRQMVNYEQANTMIQAFKEMF